MRVVQVTDIDNEFNNIITALENDHYAKESTFAEEVANWTKDRLRELHTKISEHAVDVSVRRYGKCFGYGSCPQSSLDMSTTKQTR